MEQQEIVIDDNNDAVLASKNVVLMAQVDYLLDVISEHGIAIDPKYSERVPAVVNEWSGDNVTLLNVWEAQTTKSLFVYEYVFDKYKCKLNKWLTLTLLCTSISALLAGVASALSAMGTYMWVIFAFNIATLIVSGIGSFVNGYLKMEGWPDLITAISGYCEKLNVFLCTIKAEAILPLTLRQKGDAFITKENTTYTNLIQTPPQISLSDYLEASNQFNTIANDQRPIKYN